MSPSPPLSLSPLLSRAPPLLSSQILDYTSEEYADYEELKSSLEQLEMLCTRVNEAVRSKENTEQLEWLQTHVQFTLDEV